MGRSQRDRRSEIRFCRRISGYGKRSYAGPHASSYWKCTIQLVAYLSQRGSGLSDVLSLFSDLCNRVSSAGVLLHRKSLDMGSTTPIAALDGARSHPAIDVR